ncbi:hypothetical protein BDV12DRAFT_203996 [Aspergillus spectabilis]
MKSPTEILSICLGSTWVTSYKTLSVIGRSGINKEEAKAWLEYKRSKLNFMATIYNATLLAILSAVMAFQQSSALGHLLVKVLNGHRLDDTLLQKGTSLPSKTAVFVLQAPIQMLAYGIAMFLMGHIVYVVYPVLRVSYPADDAKIAMFYEILLPISGRFFFAALILLQRLGGGF